jgi:hypothetical protein
MLNHAIAVRRCIILVVAWMKQVFMPKRNLRIVTQDVPIIGICEACNTRFKSFDVNEGDRVVKAQFDSHECKTLDGSQAAAEAETDH